VAGAFAEEQPRLLSLPTNLFNTHLVLPVRSAKTIYVRLDPNDYSIPAAGGSAPTHSGRIRHCGSHPGRKPADRLPSPQLRPPPTGARSGASTNPAEAEEQGVSHHSHGTPGPARAESETLLDLAFANGESAGSQSSQLLKLLDVYGAQPLGLAISEALERIQCAGRGEALPDETPTTKASRKNTLRGLRFRRGNRPAGLEFRFSHGRFRGGQEGECGGASMLGVLHRVPRHLEYPSAVYGSEPFLGEGQPTCGVDNKAISAETWLRAKVQLTCLEGDHSSFISS